VFCDEFFDMIEYGWVAVQKLPFIQDFACDHGREDVEFELLLDAGYGLDQVIDFFTVIDKQEMFSLMDGSVQAVRTLRAQIVFNDNDNIQI